MFQNSVDLEQVAQLRRLRLLDGDILIIRGIDTDAMYTMARSLNTSLRAMDKNVTMVFLKPDQSLEQVSESQMKAVGWIRSESQDT